MKKSNCSDCKIRAKWLKDAEELINDLELRLVKAHQEKELLRAKAESNEKKYQRAKMYMKSVIKERDK